MEGDAQKSTPNEPQEDQPPAAEAGAGPLAQVQQILRELPKYRASTLVTYILRRFSRDSCPSVAASLSYTSLLAMVPMMAIGLAMFAAFPAFSGMREQMLRVVLENIAPGVAVMVEEHLRTFIRNAGGTTGAGILGLAVTAILLINTIQTAFDRIWGGGKGFKLARFPVYWAIITIGPLLFGVAFSVSGWAFAMAQSTTATGISGAMKLFSSITPFLFEAMGFALFYRLIPTKPVRTADAITGALVATILFELLKRGFGIYLSFLGSYQTLYGALATLPIFLIWMYLAWLTVLVGAEVAASLPEWRSGRRDPDERPRRGDVLGLALGVLAVLRGVRNEPVGGEKFDRIAKDLGAEAGKLTQIMEALRGGRFIVRSDANRWVLARDLSTVPLSELVSALQLSLGDATDAPDQTTELMANLAKAERNLLTRSVEEALNTRYAGEPAPASAS